MKSFKLIQLGSKTEITYKKYLNSKIEPQSPRKHFELLFALKNMARVPRI